ncbi:MAG: 7-cyano-7-deazaguanine synthase [Acidobacteria bacterium]|nr:7-cyano-7-deazaguanine synthase [Acidobacteriota bacterium]
MADRSAPPPGATLVLLSGGLDSAVLVAHEAQRAHVLPVYVSVGLAWEPLELAMVTRLLAHAALHERIAPLERVEFTMRDVYAPSHWAIRGTPPAYDTPDEDVYLTGRNLVLLAKAGVVAAARRAARIALGPLAGNPFPDARPTFFAAMEEALSLGLDHVLEVHVPFLQMHKEDVIRRGVELGVPLDLTLSCMNPVAPTEAGGVPLHCGRCSKCRERRDAFAAIGLEDPAPFASAPPR